MVGARPVPFTGAGGEPPRQARPDHCSLQPRAVAESTTVFITLDAQPGLSTFEKHAMSSIIDIHPHIVSPDTKKYPLEPLGGTQSTWSSERPTTYQMLLDAMDEAGVAKAAI